MSKSEKPDFESFRTPSHPLIERALGRAIWNFLYLEELVVTILWEGKTVWHGRLIELNDARVLMAGEKEDAMRSLRKQLAGAQAPQDLLHALDEAIAAFGDARGERRNALTHAMGMSTVGYDADGTYMPGLGLRSKQLGHRDIRGPEALLAEAHRIEDALDPLGKARAAINEFIGGA